MESNSALRLLNVLDQLKAANTNESTIKVIKKIFVFFQMSVSFFILKIHRQLLYYPHQTEKSKIERI